MKKVFALLLALAMVFALAACGEEPADVSEEPAPTESGEESAESSEAPEEPSAEGGIAKEELKVGFIFLHDENSTYDLNFINAANAAIEELGLTEDQYEFRMNVPEGQECYDAAAELADDGCNFIFADSFGHEDYMIQAAMEFPEVEFAHATGTRAHTEGLANYHNAFASIYEGRYLAGIVAGLKLNEMIESGEITEDEAKMGYVGAYTYAEVLSGYTSFYLGAKSVCPSVTMDVTFTGSWFDETAEREAANSLIAGGCVLISQHADSMGAPSACEDAGVPNVSYNGSTAAQCPETYLVSSRIDWTPYFVYAINCVINGEEIVADWTGTLETGSVVLTELGANVAEGTQEALEEAEAALLDGSVHVFDTSTFTVEGAAVESFMADVNTDENSEGDTEVVSDGYFHESEYRSAPYFTLQIDGITLLDTAF